MNINIQPDVLNAYPEYSMGLVTATSSDARYDELKAKLSSEKFVPPLNKADIERIWTDIFHAMGASEKRLSSVVSLWRLMACFGELQPINYFVDAYNHISTKYGIPMGGYDISKLPSQDITLQFAQKGSKFHPLGLNQIEKIKSEAEIAYYCGDDVLCRYWNNKDSDITKIDDKTSNVLITFDFFGDRDVLESAMRDLISLLGATSTLSNVDTAILDGSAGSVSF